MAKTATPTRTRKRTAVQDAKALQETARRRAQERAGRSGHNGARAEAPPAAEAPQKAPTPKINKDWQKLLRPFTGTERELLRESIKASGVMVPILVDERGYIIDGMHRWQIAQELGEHCPKQMVEGLSEAQKLEQVLLLNVARRQMSAADITAAAQALRLEGFSTRKIGELLGVSKDTAHRATKGTEPKTSTVTDTKGRKQPARKAKAGKNGSEPKAERDPKDPRSTVLKGKYTWYLERGRDDTENEIAVDTWSEDTRIIRVRRDAKGTITVPRLGAMRTRVCALSGSVEDMRRLARTIIAAAVADAASDKPRSKMHGRVPDLD